MDAAIHRLATFQTRDIGTETVDERMCKTQCRVLLPVNYEGTSFGGHITGGRTTSFDTCADGRTSA